MITALLVYYACVLLLGIVYSEVIFTDFRLIVRATGIPLRIYFLFPFFVTLPLIATFIFLLPGYALGHETALSVTRHQVSGLRLRPATAVFIAIAPVIGISSLVVPMTMELHVLKGVSQRPIFAALAFFWALLGLAGVAMAVGVVTHLYRIQNAAKFD